MSKTDIFAACSKIIDQITIIKGYLQLNTERREVDYTLLILREINQLEEEVNHILDYVNKANG